MNFKLQLKKLKDKDLKEIPQDIMDVLKESAEKLAKEEIEKKALKVGNKIPRFALKNAVGDTIDSKDLLANGPLVINFYRGGW